jgi:hypothetical protein
VVQRVGVFHPSILRAGGTCGGERTADETQSSEGDFAVIVLSATIKLPVVVAKRQRVWLRGNDPED